VTKAKDVERLDFIADMEEQHMKGTIFKMSKRMTAKNKDVLGPGGIRNAAGEIISGVKRQLICGNTTIAFC